MQTPKKKRQKRDPLDTLNRKRDTALDRVIELWYRSGTPNEDAEELNKALDVLTLAHAAATFKFVGG